MEEPVRKCPIPAPRTSISSPAASPSLKHKSKNPHPDIQTAKLRNNQRLFTAPVAFWVIRLVTDSFKFRLKPGETEILSHRPRLKLDCDARG